MRKRVESALLFYISPAYLKPIMFTDNEISPGGLKQILKQITIQQYGRESLITLYYCRNQHFEIPETLCTALTMFLPHDFTVKRSIQRMRYAK